ncbi:hypothetical protein AKJ61_00750 [candidate division MSBL1 archaeon SCGC-AAA259B11]|uniref:Uncharacterized protein n=1 Tax=candidate division MSBL1 archaeon SCGC-AAA259B11 TaxID=1698260 RepID=A0A133U833_9EURY|nr:hypothetical protein AKJ61_00750 [candidate division MSBL1 archaeon SCGC-AAA259B11]
MEIEKGINPNCSEAVFRFYTLDPEKMHAILSSMLRSVNNALGDFPDKRSRVPKYGEPERYNGFSFPAINHDGFVTVEFERGSFVVCCGNNALTDDDSWRYAVIDNEVHVEEAEFSDALKDEYARDCCCGIEFFPDYPRLLENPTKLQQGVEGSVAKNSIEDR